MTPSTMNQPRLKFLARHPAQQIKVSVEQRVSRTADMMRRETLARQSAIEAQRLELARVIADRMQFDPAATVIDRAGLDAELREQRAARLVAEKIRRETLARANSEEAHRIELARVIAERMKRAPAAAAAANRERAICRGFRLAHRRCCSTTTPTDETPTKDRRS
jgi:hypothetical protein